MVEAYPVNVCCEKKSGEGGDVSRFEKYKRWVFYCQKLLKKLKRRIDITIYDLI